MKTLKSVLVLVFFISILLVSYLLITELTKRAYSTPLNEANPSNSTQGGEAFDGENLVIDGVIMFPYPGASNVSLDTAIYVFELNSSGIVNLHLNPKTPFYDIKDDDIGHDSRSLIFYPDELLQPETTYNMSGTMYGLSIWWTFTTGSSLIPNVSEHYEYIYSPHTWWIAIIISSIATILFTKIILKSDSNS